MWTLEKEFSFEASHRLPYHHGKCSRLHGHSWRGKVILEGDTLQGNGSSSDMLVDFGEIKQVINGMLDGYLDHYHLNDSLGIESPTSELVARWVFDYMKDRLPDVVAVVIEETRTSKCEYRRAAPV